LTGMFLRWYSEMYVVFVKWKSKMATSSGQSLK
jgi:hypothetical protein